MNKKQLFRKIPRTDRLLAREEAKCMIQTYGYDRVLEVLRREQDTLRRLIEAAAESGETDAGSSVDVYRVKQKKKGESPEVRRYAGLFHEEDEETWTARLLQAVADVLEEQKQPHLRKVLNGTGTILHTNLGRAPLAPELLERAVCEAGGYSNLEYDLEQGVRGNRGEALEKLLCEITGAEAAIVVNNNAAAVLLVLHALARGGEVIVSRGELVEIGGQFRIPDVMELSGARLVEVGTTNKTRPADYAGAVNTETKAFLKVHTSNYRVVGFTESVEIDALAGLGDERGIPVIADLGSGALVDLQQYGLPGEPVVREALQAGADVVCFSGDKLLGGPQSGLIVGKACYVEKMRHDPYYRAMRIDKLTAAVLEQTLLEYRSTEQALRQIPVLRMITRTAEEVEQDARALLEQLEEIGFSAEFGICPCEAQIGGGSLPLTTLSSTAVSIVPEQIAVEELERRLRALPIPVIGRIEKGRVLLDMRTFEGEYVGELIKMLQEAAVFEKE